MIRKNVTMGDIAKELGVSTVSVSKALTGKEGVSDPVREMIVNKARDMGYVYTGNRKDLLSVCVSGTAKGRRQRWL